MGDLFVHVRMKECCRATLKQLDGKKKKAGHTVSGIFDPAILLAPLGEKPVDAAMEELTSLRASISAYCGSGDMERVLRKICGQVCENHAKEHQGTEASFWIEMSLAFVSPHDNLYAKKMQTSIDGSDDGMPHSEPLDVDPSILDMPDPLNPGKSKSPGFHIDPGMKKGPKVDMLFPNPSKSKNKVMV